MISRDTTPNELIELLLRHASPALRQMNSGHVMDLLTSIPRCEVATGMRRMAEEMQRHCGEPERATWTAVARALETIEAIHAEEMKHADES